MKYFGRTELVLDPDFQCVELFSGAGGLAVGFRAAGWRISAANDIDPDAARTFRENFPEASFFEGPVEQLHAEDILRDCSISRGELGCLAGGPPCQSFSHNNHHRSAADERARLFEFYLNLVDKLLPQTLVMENVPGILSIDGGKVVDEIIQRLTTLGFDVAVHRLSAEEFGTPQLRRRVFFLASRVGPASELLPQSTHWGSGLVKLGGAKSQPSSATRRPVRVWQAIGDLPELTNGGGNFSTSRTGWPAKTAYQKDARRGSGLFYNHVCHRLGEANMHRIKHVPEGGNWRDVPRRLLSDGMKRAKLKDHTKRYGRLSRNGYASTILTKCDPHWGAYVHPTQDRTISVREAARLQGFPDTFVFHGSHPSKQYAQVGNAVPIQVARAVGQSVHEHLITHSGPIRSQTIRRQSQAA